jgi:hypothetical protein
MSLGGRDDIYPAANAYVALTPASGGRNRYAEIMANYQQAQPFSFTGYPEGYTGGFNPYKITATPKTVLTVDDTTTTGGGGGGGGGGDRSSESTYASVSPLATAELGSPEFQILDAYGQTIVLPGALLSGLISENMLPGELEQAGINSAQALEAAEEGYSSGLLFGAPPSDVSTFAGGGYGVLGAMTTPTGAGIPANPMSVDPAQAAQAIAAEQTLVASADQAEIESLLDRYPALVEAIAPVVTAPIVAPPAPVVTAPIVAPPAPVVTAPTPAPTPVAPATITVTETWRGEDPPNPNEGYTTARVARGEYVYTRPVSVAVDRFTDNEGNFDFSALRRAGYSISGIGGGQGSRGGGYTVGGYAPGSQAAAAAASGTVGGYGPGTPGFNRGGGGGGSDGGGRATGGRDGDASGGGDRGTRGGFAKGGHVSMQHLGGPDPKGPDDGYAALKDGEFVINDKAVKKYGIELMNAINSGKIKKGKLLGLLEM